MRMEFSVIGDSDEAANVARPLSCRERVGVRGYDLSIVRNPSPARLQRATSPYGRGGAECAGRPCHAPTDHTLNLSGAADLYQSRICTPFQCSTPSKRRT